MKIRVPGVKENRKFVRIDHSLPILLRLSVPPGQESGQALIHAQTRDLCSSGVCVTLDAGDREFWRSLRPDHSYLDMELDLQDNAGSLKFRGRVQWVHQNSDSGQNEYLVGTEFENLDEVGRKRLVEFLKDRFIEKARKEDFPRYEAHTAIEVENLVKKDWRGRMLLDSINLAVPQGRIVALVGPDGSGKTLLTHILASKVKFDSGRGRIFGFDLGTQARLIRKIIGLMPQRLALYNNLTGIENLDFFARGLNVPEGQINDRAAEILAFCELADTAHKQVRGMDLDQQRRLSLAVALIHHPKILILDEPFTGADPKLRYNFKTTFKRLTQAGVTILFTAHRLDNAAGCDRIALLHRGRIIAFEDPRRLMARFPSRFIATWGGGMEKTYDLRNPEEELPALMEELRSRGQWPLEKIQIQPPDPEDVWLSLVRDEDEEL